MKYIIEKGKFYAKGAFRRALNNLLKPRFSFNIISFKAFFEPNCIYTLNDIYKQLQHNKLFGVFFIHPHFRSCRVAWRTIDGVNIELFAYVYDWEWKYLFKENKRQEVKIGICQPGEWIDLKIMRIKKGYLFIYKDEVIKVDANSHGLFWMNLYPYFGGKVPAPHEMTIFLKEI